MRGGGGGIITITQFSLACLLRDKGDLAAAEPLQREAEGGARRALGDAHPYTRTFIATLADILKRRG